MASLPPPLPSASSSLNPTASDIERWRIAAVESSAVASDAESSTSSQEEEQEYYDDLKPDPHAIVEGGKGAGIHAGPSSVRGSDDVLPRISTASSTTPRALRKRRRGSKRPSIQLVLERDDRKGRYVLTADDPDIRAMLRDALAREAGPSKQYSTRFRELVFTRRFTTFDRQNPLSSESPFHGFFTLFWLAMGLLLTKVAAQNWRAYGSVFGNAELLQMMFERDVLVLGLSDGIMCGATIFGLGLQLCVLRGYLSWGGTGWIVQNLWQTAYLFTVIAWTWYRDWPWTHTIFVVLHGLVFVMKQHSYAFYNGYLSQVYRRRQILERKLQQLENMKPAESPIQLTHARTFPSTSGLDISKGREAALHRRHSVASKASTNLDTEQSEIAKVAAAIDTGEPLDEDQMQAFGQVVRGEIEMLTEELKGKCVDGYNAYPNNLTISNWLDWTCLPTLVYELEYPRQEKIDWWYVAEKTAATFGVIWVMMVISQAYIYPAVVETVRMKEEGMTLEQRWREFPWIVSDMLFPLLLEQLLSWYVIWECCLNVLAELTRFADRGFYGDWWNSTSWDQYARDWNRPVHSFLLRHVYHSSISAFHLSKGTATFVTFFLSACVHELIMYCLFKKVRGYLFAMQLAQLPLAMLSRTRLMKGRDLLGNVLFWFGLFVGPSLITCLYLIV